MSIGHRVLRPIVMALAILSAVSHRSSAQAVTVTFTYDRALPPRFAAALITDIAISAPRLAGWTCNVYSYNGAGGGKLNEGSFALDAAGAGTIDLQTAGVNGPVGVNRMIGLEFTNGGGGRVIVAPVPPFIGPVAGTTHTNTYTAAAPPPPPPGPFRPNPTTGSHVGPLGAKPQPQTLARTLMLVQLNGLPFGGSEGQSFTEFSQLYDQVVLVNSSATAYDFTDLKLYYGCNPTFFTAGSFNSPSAIASAQGVSDILSVTSTIPGIVTIPGFVSPMDARLAVSRGPVSVSGYELLTGKARPYLGGGNFGSEVSFAVASKLASSDTLPAASVAGFLAMATFTAGLGAVYLGRRRVRAARA